MRRLVIFFIVFSILFIFGCLVEKPIEKPPAQETGKKERTNPFKRKSRNRGDEQSLWFFQRSCEKIRPQLL
jgi:hypothetical protein